tara:strand:+ start:434 stop:652 length:219 start_codon:yes stop_codon:yes gene_type:complete
LIALYYPIISQIYKLKKREEKMTIETLRKKATWELKAMIKALSQPISSFLNTDEDNERLENCKLVLKERRKK